MNLGDGRFSGKVDPLRQSLIDDPLILEHVNRNELSLYYSLRSYTGPRHSAKPHPVEAGKSRDLFREKKILPP